MNCDNPNDPNHKLICPKLSDALTICKTCEAWKKADRFWRKWFKGGILIDFWRTWRSESETETSSSIPYYSGNREGITIKELHSLLIHRIYHEDMLLQQRNYNFITANVFLGAGYAFVTTSSIGELSKFGYVIVAFGFLWALLQVVYGKLHVTATNLWRMQTWMAEEALQTKFDSTLYELYELNETYTPFGTIKSTSKRKSSPYNAFPYRLPFLLGFNMSFAVTVPWMTAAFWIALAYIMIYDKQPEWWPVPIVMSIMLLLMSVGCRTAYPPRTLNKYIKARNKKPDLC